MATKIRGTNSHIDGEMGGDRNCARVWCGRSRGLAECERMELDRSHRTDLTGLCNEEVFSPSHPMKRLWVLKGRVVCLEARRPLEILETKRERC